MRVLIASFAVATLAGSVAEAAVGSDWKLCKGTAATSLHARWKACTRLIKKPGATTSDRAKAYIYRGRTYEIGGAANSAKADYQKARLLVRKIGGRAKRRKLMKLIERKSRPRRARKGNIATKGSGVCFPNLIRYNICAKARNFQRKLAGKLPMRVNRNMIVQHVIAIKNRIVLYVVWQLTNRSLNAGLARSRMSRRDLLRKLRAQTQAAVCSNRATAGFIGLGGHIQYSYRTIDGVHVGSPLVRRCPR